MNPVIITAAFNALDEILSLIQGLKAEGQLTEQQLIDHADNLDLQNKEDIKKLIAL